MALPGKALRPAFYAGFLFPLLSLRFQDGFWGWNANRILELFIEEVVLPEQVDVLP